MKNIQVTLNQQENAAGMTHVTDVSSSVGSPPKILFTPLVKNAAARKIKKEDSPQQTGGFLLIAGSMNPLCVLQLDEPPQRFHSSVLMNTSSLSWEQPFIL